MNRTSNATSSVPHNGTTFSNTTHVFNATQAHMQALNRESKSLNIELLKVTIAFIIIMLVGYLLRVISRATMVKKFTREDWMMMFAMLTGLGAGAIMLRQCGVTKVLLGGNLAAKKLNSDLIIATKTLLLVSLTFTRLSFGFFFLGLFIYRRWQRVFIWTAMISTVVFGLVAIPLDAIECRPTGECRLTWTRERSYINAVQWLLMLYSLAFIIGDLGFAVLSAILVWKLRIPKLQKIPLCILLTLGFIVVIFSIIRMETGIRIWLSDDPLRISVESLTRARATMVEVSVGIICTNLIFTRPLFAWTYVKLGSTLSRITGSLHTKTSANQSFSNHDTSSPSRLISTWTYGEKTLTIDENELELKNRSDDLERNLVTHPLPKSRPLL